MQKYGRLIGLRQLLDEDVDAVCADLTAEFGALSGGRWLRPSRQLS
jgi:UDP-glucuronate decarboxylase